MKTNKLRIILDTNVLLVSLRPTHRHFWITEAIMNEDFILLVSNEIIEEYLEKLDERYGSEVRDLLLNPLIFSPNVEFISPSYRFLLIVDDEDDDKFVDCAVAGNADYIVTHDRHFKVLKEVPFPKIRTIKIDEFKEILENWKKEAF